MDILIDEYHPEQPVYNLNFGSNEQIVFEDSLAQIQREDRLPNEALREFLADASDEDREQYVKSQQLLAKIYHGPGGP